MVCFSPVRFGVLLTFGVLALRRGRLVGDSDWFVCPDEGLTLETSATHQIPQAKNIPYQHLLIKLVFSLFAIAEKIVFSKLVFQCFSYYN